jgi:Fic family protein
MQPVVPQGLPPRELRVEGLVTGLGRANRALARFDGIMATLPNPEVLLSPLTTQEAVLSSKIEGTQATLEEVLAFEAEDGPITDERNHEIREILNYRSALRIAESRMKSQRFKLPFLNTLHARLLHDVRGKEKKPGAFRTTQNWIGEDGCKLKDAEFVPPIPAVLPEHLEAWEKFYLREDFDPILQIALLHAQFEILHPYLDGNGRMGRILIPMFLCEKRILTRPMFYLSAWLESRRDDYIGGLRNIGRTPSAWNDWCAFFFQGVEEQASLNVEKAQAIHQLYLRLEKTMLTLTHSPFAVHVLKATFHHPVFQQKQIQFENMPTPAAIHGVLRQLVAGGALKIIRQGKGRRPTLYALHELINLCEGKKVF